MAEDEDFPPETEKLPTDFAFRVLGHLNLKALQQDQQQRIRKNLLSVANIYGLVFVGCQDGFKVYSSKDLINSADKKLKVPAALTNVSLRFAPHWLAVSSDNLTLAVCCSSKKGLQVVFFDTRNLINTSKPAKTSFANYVLSKSSTDVIADLQWNPSVDTSHFLSICVSSGAFYVLSVKENVEEVAKKPQEFSACSVCWSPRGKQMMVGRKDGSMQQYTPIMEIRRTVPVCDVVDQKVKVCDVLWLSTYQVATTYVPLPETSQNADDTECQPNLFLVNLPPAKEQDKAATWRNYEDPCYGIGGSQEPHFFSTYLDKWSLFVLASSRAPDIAVIGKNKETNAWEIWHLVDGFQAELLNEEDSDQEPIPLGISVISTATEKLRVGDAGDSKHCEPMPIYAALTSNGYLSLFHMVNQQADYPNIVAPAKELSMDGERAAVPNNPSSLDSGAPSSAIGITPGGKQKLSVKPSLLVKTSTPKLPFSAPTLSESDSSKLSTTPLQGFSRFSPTPASHNFRPAAPAAKSLAGSFSLLPAATRLPESPVPAPSEPDSTQDTSSIQQMTTAKAKAGNDIHKPEPIKRQSSHLDQLPKLSDHVRSIEHVKSQPATAGSGAAPTESLQDTTEPRRRKSLIRKTRERVNSLQYSDTDAMAEGLRSEIIDFDRELSDFLQESSSVKHEVASLGSDQEKVDLKKNVETLAKFRTAITRNTADLHEEIKTSRTRCLETFSALQSVDTWRRRVDNPVYRDTLHSRPLDLTDQRRLKDIRTLHQYIKELITQTNSALDDQWNKFVEVQKPTSLRKSKRRMQYEENGMIHKVMSNQMQILHDQEKKIMLLGQQLDKLRLLNSATLHSPVGNQYRRSMYRDAAEGASGDNSDLSTLANSLLRDRRSSANGSGDNADKADSKRELSASRISPKKTSQLSHILGSRKSTPVRCTPPGLRSSFVAPAIQRRESKADDALSRDGAYASSRSASIASEYSQTSSDDTARKGSIPSSDNTSSEKSLIVKSVKSSPASVHPPPAAAAQLKLRSVPSPLATRGFAPIGASKETSPKPSITPGSLSSSEQYSSEDDDVTSINVAENKAPGPTFTRKPLGKTSSVMPFIPGLGDRGTAFAPTVSTAAGSPSASPLNMPARPSLPVEPSSGQPFLSSEFPPQARGSATLAYGAPEGEVPRTKPGKFDAVQTEAPSNLNNPPQVVNIKEVKQPQVVNVVACPTNFEPGPEVPPGAAAVVQRVLDTVSAEQQNADKQQAASFLPPTTSAPPTATEAPTTQPKMLSALLASSTPASSLAGVARTQSSTTSLASFSFKLPSNNSSSGATFGSFGTDSQFTSPFSLSMPGQSGSADVKSLPKPDLTQVVSDPQKPPETAMVAKATPLGFSIKHQSSVSAPELFNLVSKSQAQPVGSADDTPTQDIVAAPVVTVAPTPTSTPVPAEPPTSTAPADDNSSKPNEPASSQDTAPPAVSQQLVPAPSPVFTQTQPAPTPPQPEPTPQLAPTPTQLQVAGGDSEIETDVAPPSGTGGLFSSSTAPASGFGFSSAAGGGDVFGGTATAASAASAFGQTSTSAGTGLFGNVGGQQAPAVTTTADSLFSSTFGAMAKPAAASSPGGFGSAPSFGASAPASGGFGGGFLSGLGSAPKHSPSGNPFAAGAPAAPASDTSTLFGNSGASSFGQQQPTSSAFGSSTPAGGFNAFTKPTAGFGSPSSFGGSPGFGAKPAFGTASQFGSAAAFGSSPGFGSPASFGSPPGIGAAATSAGHVFGSSSAAFGAFGNTSSSSGFSAFATQSTPSFGDLGGQSQNTFGGGSTFGAGGMGGQATQQSKPSFSGWR